MRNIKKHKAIVKYTKWLLVITGALCIAFLLFAVIVSHLYKDKAKSLIEEALNKHLQTEITIGHTNLSLLRQFPFATFSFHDVVAKEAVHSSPKDTLLTVGRVSLHFNIIDIFRGHYRIKGINLSDGTLDIKVFEDGTNNYTFWKTDIDEPSESFELILDKISTRNLNINYANHYSLQHYFFWIQRANFSGRFYEDSFSFSANASTIIDHIKIGELSFLSGKKADFNFLMEVHSADGMYNISHGLVKIGHMQFDLAGFIQDTDEYSDLNLKIVSKNIDAEEFISELPQTFHDLFNDYMISGRLDIEADIKGPTAKGVHPELNFHFGIENGHMTHKSTGQSVEKLFLKGYFTNGAQKTLNSSVLNIEHLRASLKQGHINGAFEIENFNSPRITIQGHADACLNELMLLTGSDILADAEGEAILDVFFSTQLDNFKSFTPQDFIQSKCVGKIELKNCALRLQNHKRIERINADLEFNNNDIEIKKLKAHLGQSDFSFQGYFRNALSYLFLPDESLIIDARLNANFIALDELLATPESTHDGEGYSLSFSPHIGFNLSVNADRLRFGKFDASRIHGQFQLKDKILYAKDVSLETFDGLIKIDGSINDRHADYFKTVFTAHIEQCNIREMFYSFNNFKQDNMTDRHLKGTLSSHVSFAANWDNTLEIDYNSLYVLADITIEDGELIDYEPIKELSRFLRVDDLSHIRFETLENSIEISKRVIHFPDLRIRSDAINIDATGTHGFDNMLDYNMQIFLSDVLGRRARLAKRENEEFGVVQDDGTGRFTLFIKIGGTFDQPHIRYDTGGALRKARQNIRDDLRETGQRIRELIAPPAAADTVAVLESRRDSIRRMRREERKIQEGFRLE